MPDNIFAYTEPGHQYPAYVSINKDETGSVTVTVRSRGNGGLDVASIALPPEALAAMSIALAPT